MEESIFSLLTVPSLAQQSLDGCPISRVLCEKWGFFLCGQEMPSTAMSAKTRREACEEDRTNHGPPTSNYGCHVFEWPRYPARRSVTSPGSEP
jgi:hypothetical protein